MTESQLSTDSEDCQSSHIPMFSNDQVFCESIPTTETLEYSKLQPGYRNVSLITTTLVFIFLGCVATAVIYFNNFRDFAIYIYVLLFSLYGFFMTIVYLGFKKKSYALRERDLVFNEGLIWQSSVVIPFNRVQHCEISQGPVERMFNLAELKVFTAGGSSSDMSIPGLEPSVAEQMKEFIILKTGVDEEE